MVYASSHNLPPNNKISCAKKAILITKFQQQKNLPTVGGGHHTLPRLKLLRSLALLPPPPLPLKNPDYASGDIIVFYKFISPTFSNNPFDGSCTPLERMG